MRLAIIGAGVGGCSTAFFAKRLVPSCEITVYERSNRIGGRVYGVLVDNQRVEIGAAFFKNSHQLLIGLLKEVGIEATPIRVPSSIGVWNGEKFIFKIGNHALSTIRLFMQNPLNILRLYWILRELNSRSRIVYREVKNSPGEWDELFATAGVMGWLQRSLREVLLEKGVGSNFIDNMLEPMTRVIYNQDSSINAYAGLSTINILSGGTYKIPSGNEVLPIKLLEASGAALKLGVEVESVKKREDGLFEVSGGEFSEKYDSVIIANHGVGNIVCGTCLPLELSSKKYQKVYVQIVRGALNHSYFNLKSGRSPPDTIVSTRGVPFTHIIRLESESGHPLYSIASTTPIEDLGEVFLEPEVVFRHIWDKAYPVLEPIRTMPRCRLDEHLFYTGCSESAVSAMEVSILSAFNTVRLLGKEFGTV